MFRWKYLLVLLLISVAVLTTAQENQFDPRLTLLGLSGAEPTGSSIEWVLTTGNSGAVAGDNVVLTLTFAEGLLVERVQSAGTITSKDRSVTIELGDLASGASVQFSILTSVSDPSAIGATACMNATNLTDALCVSSMPVQALPATGETPFWRRPFLLAGVLTVSGSLLLIGMGLMGLQVLQES